MTARIKKYKSILKKKKKKHDKAVFIAKSKFNNIEVLVSIALIGSNTSQDEFVLINNVLKEFYDIIFYLYFIYDILCYCLKCRKNTGNIDQKVVRTKNGGIILLSKCAVCNSEKLKFLKEREAKELISSLTGIKIQYLSDLPIANIVF